MKKFFLGLIIFLTDLGLKKITLQIQPDQPLISHWLSWTFFANPALAFSLSFPQPLIILTSILILLILIILVYKKPNYLFPASLIFLGATSNLIDRLLHSFVIDYFYFYPISYFNLADGLIFLGVIFLAIKIYQRN
ncbi:MAG TPA: signal peptidase II [Candidatus Magasanikbacteria bacterium]|nr:signal peptidase II [Candidatus Magasanikbacteria bacterium]